MADSKLPTLAAGRIAELIAEAQSLLTSATVQEMTKKEFALNSNETSGFASQIHEKLRQAGNWAEALKTAIQ